MKAVRIANLSYAYVSDGMTVPILHNIFLDIEPGEFIAIQGPSGSGKSTLLYLLGGLLKPQQGEVEIFGQDTKQLDDEGLARLRSQQIGFVFQQFHLLPRASVLNNILMPTLYSPVSVPNDQLVAKAKQLAEVLGVEHRLNYLPNQLSGGQQQRVAIARALINDPQIILADEPTGNLDSKTALQTLTLLRRLSQEFGKTVIIITHDNEVAAQCDRVIHIKDGMVEGQAARAATKVAVKERSSMSTKPLGVWRSLLAIKEHIPLAMSNLARNKTRTALTMLGIAVGVAAVLSMVTLGQFTKEKILAGYAELGVNTLIFNGRPNWEIKATDKLSTPFRFFSWEKDILPLKRIFPQIERMSPLLMNWHTDVNFGGRTLESDVRLVGVNEEALIISKRKMLYGRNFVRSDVERKNPVCMIGYEIAQRLFTNVYPLGQVLRVMQDDNSFGCRVIAVLDDMTSNSEWSKPNLQVHLPYTFYQALSENYWNSQIREVILQLQLNADIQKTGEGIRQFFIQKYGVAGKFRVDTDSILLAQMTKFLTLFTVLLGVIAMVTLIVGGIGITNMMLVSVSERFREIGLRKAVGATDTSIRLQFLAEAIAVCGLAGALGLAAGFAIYHGAIWGASRFVSKLTFEWTIDPTAFWLSVLSIVSVGVLSGLFPAFKAEKLQVIEALRSE